MSKPQRQVPKFVVPAVFVFLGGLVIVILLPVLLGDALHYRKAACMGNIKQVTLGIIMYQTDADDSLPPAKTWADLLKPYIKVKQLFICPDLPHPSTDQYGHAFWSALSLRKGSEFKHPESEPAIFDSSDLSWNANGPLSAAASPYRHGEHGNCFGMLDGHTKFLSKEQLLRLHRQSPIN